MQPTPTWRLPINSSNMAAAPFNWSEYLLLATTLSQNPDDASRRTSISRAYYAVFHAATTHAQENGYADRSHGRLWKMYQADLDRSCKKLSTIGNAMKRFREEADYVANVPRVAEMVTEQLQEAQRFMALLGGVPATSPRPLPPSPRRVCPFCAQQLPF